MTATEHEAARVAAAFGIDKWDDTFEIEKWCSFNSERDGQQFYVSFSGLDSGIIDCICVENDNGRVEIERYSQKEWLLFSDGCQGELMARCLYCLNIQVEDEFLELPELSGTQKMEFALDFPREFWPQQWIEEVAQS